VHAQEESGIGSRLRAARERLGWSREALAVRSGVSWSAVAQVESGRRRHLRPDTLSGLATALGVSIDYLVDGRPTPPILSHQAFFYKSRDEFAETVSDFLREGLERSEPGIALTSRVNIKLLRERLGEDAKRVELIEWSDRLSEPGQVLELFGDFLSRRLGEGAVWVRVVGEPVWEGRPAAEARLWTKLESLFNLALAGSPMTLVCPYDTSSVDAAIVRDAHATHPRIVEAGEVRASRDYRDPGPFALEH
jgi:transcriptional regulator with XRE-family HTH domain